MTDDNRPTNPAEPGQPQPESPREGDWFESGSAAGKPAASGNGETSGEAGGDWFGRANRSEPASPESRNGVPVPGGTGQPEGERPGEVPVQRAASGEVGGEEWFGLQGVGQTAASGSEPVADRPAENTGEIPAQPAASVGPVVGTPGEVSGPPGVTRNEWQGHVPQSEWSAGPAQPPPVEWARPAEPERVVFGSAAGPPPTGQFGGGGTPPGGHYLIRPGVPPPQPQQPKRRGPGALVAGVAVLSLLVGGGAGALGGYLVADSSGNSPVSNALDQQPPADQTSSSPSGTVEAVAQKVSPSVVQLQVQGGSAAGEGSGFIISSDGLIITNNHVVEVAADNGKITAVFADGSTAAATIVGRDPTSDVAVVKAEGKSDLPIVDLGSSDALKVGQGVVAIGSPFELAGTVTSGIVSSLQRPTRAGGEDGSQATVMDAIQTDAAINPGNSGGPLVNMQGQVIGINSAIYSPQSGNGQGGSVGIGFAIPINQARRTADEIVKSGKATQTVLGVSVRDGQDGGAQIVEVVAGGAGEKAGLKQGDVVTKLDDRRIDTSDALVAAVRSHAPGDKVRLELGNGSRTVEATLAGQTVETE
jgi:putative serine protease PepD